MQKTLIIAVILSMNFVMVKSKSAKAKNEGKPSRQPLKRLVNGAVQNPDDEATKRQVILQLFTVYHMLTILFLA